jgi:general secretion pathway protein K
MTQAEAVAHGAFDLAMILLIEDAKNSTTDDLKEAWAQPLPVFPVEGGAVTAAISDAQGRFNLNNLAVTSGSGTPPWPGIFRKLLTSLDLNPDLTDTIRDWLDSDSNIGPNGAEDNEYLALPTPYRAANQPLQSVDELRLVRGFTAEVVQKLRPWVTVLPVTTAVININTAPATVLSALCDVPLSEAEQWVKERDKNPAPRCQNAKQGTYGTKTDYFEVTVQTQFGRLRRQSQVLIWRQSGSATILWRRELMSNTVLPTKTEEGK